VLQDLAAQGEGGERRYARTAIERILGTASGIEQVEPAA
jgi:hypothetical protein